MNDVLLGGGTDRADDPVIRPCAHVRIRNLAGTVVLAVGEDVVELSEVAETIWRAMAPGRLVSDVTRVVADAHDASVPEVADDVLEFLTDLRTRGFVTFGPLSAGGAG
jgi:hypothetical protein